MKKKIITMFIIMLVTITSFSNFLNITMTVKADDPVIDESFTKLSGPLFSFDTADIRVAQSFTPDAKVLTKVKVYVNRTYVEGFTSLLYALRIALRDSLNPDADNLRIQAWPVVNIPWFNNAGGWFPIDFTDNPLGVTPGQTYYIVLWLSDDLPDNLHVNWWGGTSESQDLYQDGEALKSYDNGNNWEGISNSDFNFAVWGYNQQNDPPAAYIDSIDPNPALEGKIIHFSGHGEDTDGTITEYNWRSNINGNISPEATFDKSTLSTGSHTIYFKVKDNNGKWSEEDIEILIINEEETNNPPNKPDKPEGYDYFWEDEDQYYKTSATDPDGDKVRYYFDWGDGTEGDWTEWCPSGNPKGKSQYWDHPGIFQLQAKAQDEHGAESDWSDPLKVEVFEKITWTEFYPADVEGVENYANNITYVYGQGDTAIRARASKSTGAIGGVVIASVNFLFGGWGEARAGQSLEFYTGTSKNVQITAEMTEIYGEYNVGGSVSEFKIGYRYNNGEIHWIVIDSFLDWDFCLGLILQLISGLIGANVEGVWEAIGEIPNIISYTLLLSDLQNLLNQGNAKKYNITFDMNTKENDYNEVRIYAQTESDAGKEQYAVSTFAGIISKIRVDGIAPPTKPKVEGPSTVGRVGWTFMINLQSLDPNDDEIQYEIDWGDGQQRTTDFHPSGEKFTLERYMGYSTEGDYTIKVYAIDKDGLQSSPEEFQISVLENRPPTKPVITGPNSGKIGIEYTYTFTSTDPDDHHISYYIDWGDGETTSSDDYLTSGTTFTTTHAWYIQENYIIKAKCIDHLELESDWATHEIKFSKNRNKEINMPLLRILENHPFIYQFLWRLLKLITHN